MPGQTPSFVSTSLWQTPQACTLMSTCPTPGLGISRSTIWKSAPALGIWAAFIGAIATFVVAMTASYELSIAVLENSCWRGDRTLFAAPVFAFAQIGPRTTGDATADICGRGSESRPAQCLHARLPSGVVRENVVFCLYKRMALVTNFLPQ